MACAIPARAECHSVADWRADTIKGSPAFDIGPAEPVTPGLLAFVVQQYNATPPVSDIHPDAGFMLLGRVKANGMPFGDVLFGLFRGGCLVANFTVPMPHAQRGEPV